MILEGSNKYIYTPLKAGEQSGIPICSGHNPATLRLTPCTQKEHPPRWFWPIVCFAAIALTVCVLPGEGCPNKSHCSVYPYQLDESCCNQYCSFIHLRMDIFNTISTYHALIVMPYTDIWKMSDNETVWKIFIF